MTPASSKDCRSDLRTFSIISRVGLERKFLLQNPFASMYSPRLCFSHQALYARKTARGSDRKFLGAHDSLAAFASCLRVMGARNGSRFVKMAASVNAGSKHLNKQP